jgi:hypothetical protein
MPVSIPSVFCISVVSCDDKFNPACRFTVPHYFSAAALPDASISGVGMSSLSAFIVLLGFGALIIFTDPSGMLAVLAVPLTLSQQ